MRDYLKNLKSIKDIDVKDKTIIMRADMNVPLFEGNVTDDTRITCVVPTIQNLTERGAKLVIITHFGRPKGQIVPEMSVKPIADALAKLLPNSSVNFVDDIIGEKAKTSVEALSSGDIAILENTRFNPEEEKNGSDFSKRLAAIGDIYVNDAFSCSHRAHSSTEGITKYIPSYAGLSMMKEINALSAALEDPKMPVTAVVGGAKVSTKIPVLTNLVAKVNNLIIGGGMANTFLYAEGVKVGKSLFEPDFASTVGKILASAAEYNCRICLPTDVVIAKEFAEGAENKMVSKHNVGEDDMILDVGDNSLDNLKEVINNSKTVLWNGPLGAFEIEPFGIGTFALAKLVAEKTKDGSLVSIAGGGDTVAALNNANASDDFTYISTAGGAFLEWLEGKDLPGIVALGK